MGSTDLQVQLLRDAAVPDAHHMFRTKGALTARIVRKRENTTGAVVGPNVVENVDERVNVEPGHCILFRSSMFESGAYTYLRYGCIDDVNPVSGERDPVVLPIQSEMNMLSIVACSYLPPLLTRQAHVAFYYSQKPYAPRRMPEALPENLLRR